MSNNPYRVWTPPSQPEHEDDDTDEIPLTRTAKVRVGATWDPSYDARKAGEPVNVLICNKQTRDGSVSWQEISNQLMKQLHSGPAPPPTCCKNRWLRMRIMCKVIKGEDVPREWFTGYLSQNVEVGEGEESAMVLKVLVEREEDVPARLVEESVGWLTECRKAIKRWREEESERAIRASSLVSHEQMGEGSKREGKRKTKRDSERDERIRELEEKVEDLEETIVDLRGVFWVERRRNAGLYKTE